MKALTQDELGELSKLSKRGNLMPEDVVKAAESPKSALHSRFTWDDGEAAKQWRIEEARRVIRAAVHVIHHEEREYEVRAYVSLPSDRAVGGGYRSIRKVMSDEAMREELLAEVYAQLQQLRTRYAELKELSKVWAEVDSLVV